MAETSVRRLAALAALAAARTSQRYASTATGAAAAATPAAPAPRAAAAGKPPVAVVMLNMGGPGSLDGAEDGVKPFLTRLFSDGEIIKLGPLQKWLGPYIAEKRAPRIAAQYAAIGGRSPIGHWTAYQGTRLAEKLNARYPHLGPFKSYIAFRYAPPLTHDTLAAMAADGVTRAVAFTQYPQFSCTTTGSSLNHLWRETLRTGMERAVAWSVIDRWHTHPGFLAAVARRVALGLAGFHPSVRSKVVIMFSAHSVPMMVVNRGDAYVNEVAATVDGVMALLRQGVDIGDGKTDGGVVAPAAASGSSSGSGSSATNSSAAESTVISAAANPHVLAWQSKVGFLPWMGPSTAAVIKGLGAQGHGHVLAVPIAFTSDHIETLFEIDKEYGELAHESGIAAFRRAPSLNDEPLLTDAMADIVAAHVASGRAVASGAYALNCPGCTNPACRTVINPVAPYTKAREANAVCKVAGWPTPADVAALQARGTEPCP